MVAFAFRLPISAFPHKLKRNAETYFSFQLFQFLLLPRRYFMNFTEAATVGSFLLETLIISEMWLSCGM